MSSPRNLTGIEINTVYRLEKHGQLMLSPVGKFYSVPSSYAQTEAKVIEALIVKGICRKDRCGESTFATLVQKP